MLKYIKHINMKNKSQKFRFCCRCVRMTLMERGRCYFCNGDFLITTSTEYTYKRKKKDAVPH